MCGGSLCARRLLKKRGIMFNFDERVDRRGTWSSEWDITDEQLRKYGMAEKRPENAICLSTADMDFHCAPCIKEAMQRVVDFNLYGYIGLNRESCPAYYEAVTGWFSRRYQWNIDPDDLIYVNGTIKALEITLETLTASGDGVLITPPVYSPFQEIIEQTGRRPVLSPLRNDDGYYSVDFDDFERKAAQPDTKAFILCNPHNPTGRVWSEEELVRMYDICTRNGVLVIADEIHCDLTRTGVTYTPMGRVTDGKNLVVCSGANKTFNMASLHASNIITHDPVFKEKIRDLTDWISPSPFTVAAVIAAYTQGDQWVDELRAYLDGNVDWAVDFLHKHMPKVKVRRPEGTYVLWMDFREYGLTTKERQRRITDIAGVIKEQGELFDPENGAGFERICLSSQRAVIQEAFTRIADAFADL